MRAKTLTHVLFTILILTGCVGAARQAPTATAIEEPKTTGLPDTIVENGSEMALVPAGSFEMGAIADDGLAACQEFTEPFFDYICRSLFEDEEPVHTVYLEDYYIDLYEVTNAQFAAFLNDQGN